MKNFDLSTLWHKVLDVNTTNYFQILEEVKIAVNNGDINHDEFREMCKQLGKFRKFFYRRTLIWKQKLKKPQNQEYQSLKRIHSATSAGRGYIRIRIMFGQNPKAAELILFTVIVIKNYAIIRRVKND